MIPFPPTSGLSLSPQTCIYKPLEYEHLVGFKLQDKCGEGCDYVVQQPLTIDQREARHPQTFHVWHKSRSVGVVTPLVTRAAYMPVSWSVWVIDLPFKMVKQKRGALAIWPPKWSPRWKSKNGAPSVLKRGERERESECTTAQKIARVGRGVGHVGGGLRCESAPTHRGHLFPRRCTVCSPE